MLRLRGGSSLELPCPIRDAPVQLGIFLAMLLSNRINNCGVIPQARRQAWHA